MEDSVKLQVARDRYQRLAKAAIDKLQRSCLRNGLAVEPAVIDAAVTEAETRITKLLQDAFGIGIQLGYERGVRELEAFQVPRPTDAELADATLYEEFADSVHRRFEVARMELTQLHSPPDAVSPLRSSIRATFGTIVHQAYNAQHLAVLRAASFSKEPVPAEYQRPQFIQAKWQEQFSNAVSNFFTGIASLFAPLIGLIVDVVDRIRRAIRWAYQHRIRKEWHTAAAQGLPCRRCRKMEGMIVELWERFPWPSNSQYPPLHPGCNCYVRPVVHGGRSTFSEWTKQMGLPGK